MKGESLIWSRIAKNLLYVLAGTIFGAAVISGLPFSRTNIIICVVAFVLFIIEAFVYLRYLIDELRKTKLRRKK
jgi:hypothetical protein